MRKIKPILDNGIMIEIIDKKVQNYDDIILICLSLYWKMLTQEFTGLPPGLWYFSALAAFDEFSQFPLLVYRAPEWVWTVGELPLDPPPRSASRPSRRLSVLQCIPGRAGEAARGGGLGGSHRGNPNQREKAGARKLIQSYFSRSFI